jgi:drug/metabolite transporter (DMT)-like permease
MSENRPVDTTPAPAPSAPTLPGLGGDWPAQAADKIVQVVGQVRDRTTGPAITVARGAVYGLLAGILGAVCLVLFIICLVRLLDTYVVGEDNTWLAHLIVGLLFSAVGMVMWRMRRAPEDEAA